MFQIDPHHILMVAEIGINHNGDINIAKKLIDVAVVAGFDVVKFQKRDINVVYTAEELDKPRETPFGTTNRELKQQLEFGKEEYDIINEYCRYKGIMWTASPWDINSLGFLLRYDIPYIKIASASLTDAELLMSAALSDKPVFISTGMSSPPMIYRAKEIIEEHGTLGCIYHCTSTYPSATEELNLNGIKTLKNMCPSTPIGFSGHEKGIATSVMAAALGAQSIERHITIDRTMFGSDQAASLEPRGQMLLIRDIRDWEKARGDGKIVIYDSERPIEKKLRRVSTLFERESL